MGTLFWLFGHISCYVSILVLALAISAGLYLVAELAEEYPNMTSKVLRYALGAVIAVQLILWVDGLPAVPCIVQLVAFAAYASTLMHFPFVQLFSLPTISSVILFLATNGVWLHYLLDMRVDTISTLGYFVVMVWAVPCGLFVSLSANDFMLPGISGQPKLPNGLENTSTSSSGNVGGKQRSLFKAVFDSLADYNWMIPGLGNTFNAFRMLQDKRR